MMIISKKMDFYVRLLQQIEPLQTELLQHKLYSQVNDLASLRVFMESHVFAVWDFMTLVKALQRHLTCVNSPWLPPADIYSARLINSIVLAEETDEIALGYYSSHFELYISAMREVQANTTPVQGFVNHLRQGYSLEQAWDNLAIPNCARSFVRNTLNISNGTIPEVAAAFLLGRENIIPAMFHRILTQIELTHDISCKGFRLYLNRHIHLDEEIHAPMGLQLLKNVCGEDPLKWRQATTSAQKALYARLHLWDGVTKSIKHLELARKDFEPIGEMVTPKMGTSYLI
ncbi:MAG: DUF3050 domain-containing protein [Leptolyngbyaceae cyanobacterium MO_188.B28]|nr:DUF3050 domain-containing protein [Leptolyngbyaceae cyanobacterium MO_188.B28]